MGERLSLWQKIRRVWITLGITATVIFFGWSYLAFRATGEAHAALDSTAQVVVTRGDAWWTFVPGDRSRMQATGLAFFPGSLVEPAAYAPLVHAAAAAGFPAVLVELPRRGGFGGADDPIVPVRAREAMRGVPGVERWVLGGHSRGAVVASQLFRMQPSGLAGLVLIGSSHPRDFSLAQTDLPVMKIYGTRDTVADVSKIEATRSNLPPQTRWIRIEGGNHSQFGWYGFQPGDWPASISRQQQQEAMVTAVVGFLADVERAAAGG